MAPLPYSSDLLSIAALNPSLPPPPTSKISGVITLLWPYSSSTRTCALLLADPDFRLRSKRGQVRVRFVGPAAAAVASRRLGIGDLLEVGLAGAQWEEDVERERTPGKGVEGGLVFGGRFRGRVWRGGRQEGVGEEVVVSEVDERQKERVDEVGTPAAVPAFARDRSNGLLRKSLGGGDAGTPWTYASPAFAKRVRLSGDEESNFLDSAFDPFVDDDDDGAVKSPGKRTSFGPGLRWRLKSRTPSPAKESFDFRQSRESSVEVVPVESPLRAARKAQDVVETVDEDADMEENSSTLADNLPLPGASQADQELPAVQPMDPTPILPTTEPPERPSTPPPPQTAMAPPPPPPRLSMPAHSPPVANNATQAETGEPSTPTLEPVQSPNLPLPSPFPTDARTSMFPAAQRPYTPNSLFGALGNAAAVIERRRISGGLPAKAVLPPPRHSPVPPPSRPVEQADAQRRVAPPPPAREPSEPANEQPAKIETGETGEPAAAAADVVDLTEDSEDEEMLNPGPGAPDGAAADVSFSTTVADDEMHDEFVKSYGGQQPLAQTEQDDFARVPATEKLAHEDIAAGEEFLVSPLGEDGASAIDEEAPGGHGTLGPSAGQAAEQPFEPPAVFGLDGAGSAPPTPRASSPQMQRPDEPKQTLRALTPAKSRPVPPLTAATPPSIQTDKERMKKSTYRSLFGLRSPQKEDPASAPLPEAERQEERFIPGWFFEVERLREEGGEQDDGIKSYVESEEKEAGGDDVVMLEGDNSEQRDLAGHAEEDEIVADDTMLLDDDLEDERVRSGTSKLALEDQDVAPVAPRSTMQVVEFDASSDAEEEQAQASPAAVTTEPQLASSSSPVVQDSLEDLQDKNYVVSEDDQRSRQRALPNTVQRDKEEQYAADLPLSSGLPTEQPSQPAVAKESADNELRPAQDDDRQSAPTPTAGDLPVFSQDLAEEHIAPPRSTAATTVLERGSSSESEQFPSSPIARPRRSPRKQQKASHPALPLSPSNSQSLQHTQSQSVSQESARNRLPPTPQLTQRESSTRTEERLSQKTPAPKHVLRSESSLRAEVKAAESPITPQTKTPARRSARIRTSQVPDVLSEWFSPRSPGAADSEHKAEPKLDGQTTLVEEREPVQPTVGNGHATPSKPKQHRVHSTGFATDYSYFTPLSRLPGFINASSQSAHGTAIDILAVVADKTSEPVRAKSGPKDHFTVLRVADPSNSDGVRVEVYRPYKTTLPVAEIGDVVLLRGFVVKSRKRAPYLLSADVSAWCVWRFLDAREASKPVWARKAKGVLGAGVVEEVKGPPVEFGDGEREHVGRLREWWGDAGEVAAKL